ncbi:MAG TPA: PIN domain-containing protein [Solirubrobacteraceae bacterium]|jgi:predicted nucleic acid-binding protein|nr:PIN domain-containing protein [Solirubrobacteraceae bacterium]
MAAALADTSAWSWRGRSPQVSAGFVEMLANDGIATCAMVKFELLVSAQNGREFDEIRQELDELEDYAIGALQWQRALHVYRELAHQGGAHQRSVGHQDLLIAAAAEAAEVELLHYDEDFDRIAAITGQPTRWIAPRGSL